MKRNKHVWRCHPLVLNLQRAHFFYEGGREHANGKNLRLRDTCPTNRRGFASETFRTSFQSGLFLHLMCSAFSRLHQLCSRIDFQFFFPQKKKKKKKKKK